MLNKNNLRQVAAYDTSVQFWHEVNGTNTRNGRLPHPSVFWILSARWEIEKEHVRNLARNSTASRVECPLWMRLFDVALDCPIGKLGMIELQHFATPSLSHYDKADGKTSSTWQLAPFQEHESHHSTEQTRKETLELYERFGKCPAASHKKIIGTLNSHLENDNRVHMYRILQES